MSEKRLVSIYDVCRQSRASSFIALLALQPLIGHIESSFDYMPKLSHMHTTVMLRHYTDAHLVVARLHLGSNHVGKSHMISRPRRDGSFPLHVPETWERQARCSTHLAMQQSIMDVPLCCSLLNELAACDFCALNDG